jgi:hypothetical protein
MSDAYQDELAYPCYSLHEVSAFVQGNEKKIPPYMRRWYQSYFDKKQYLNLFNEIVVREIFHTFKTVKSNVFEQEKCPIFLISSRDHHRTWDLTINPQLSSIDFMRIKDPFTAYQEIRMFLDNMAYPEKPIPQLSNEDLAHSKGHGDKYSFRRPPTEKK